MAMDLTESYITSSRVMSGGGEVEILTAGKTLKIETSPDGDEILAVTVPVGKVWEVRMHISISETDA